MTPDRDSSQRRPARNGKPVAVETLERTRRIETRVTQLLVGLGFGGDVQKPEFNPGSISRAPKVVLPSPHSSMKEILAAIPDTLDKPIEIFVGDQHVATLRKAP